MDVSREGIEERSREGVFFRKWVGYMSGTKGALGWADKRVNAPPCRNRKAFSELETGMVSLGADLLSLPYQQPGMRIGLTHATEEKSASSATIR